MNRPCYSITPGEGLDQVALLSNPAIQLKGIALEDHKKMQFADKLKLRVAAPVMVPGLKIYRRDEELGEYDIVFTKETIEQLHQEFVLTKKSSQFNLDHNQTETVDSVILFSWIVKDGQTDLSHTQYGLDPLPEGTLFYVSQFDEKDRQFFMDEIVAKDRTGYSVEGFLGLQLEKLKAKIKEKKMKNKYELPTAGGVLQFEDNMLVGFKPNPMEVITPTVLAAPVADEKKKDEPAPDAPADAPVAAAIPPAEPGTPPAAPADKAAPAPAAPAEGNPEEEKQDTDMVMALVKPMFDEVYKKIAELQTAVESLNPSQGKDQALKIVETGSAVNSLVEYFKHSH